MALRKHRIFRQGTAGVLFLAWMFFPLALCAEGIGEGDVKAAFVLNFIRFVEWPASSFDSPEDPILFSVLGDDPAAASLDSLDGKVASGRRVVVRKVSVLSDLEWCHVLFVGASEKDRLAPVLDVVRGWPVLKVADFEGFVGRGGTIGFIRQGTRVAFEINEESARKSGLKVNAKLLYLGKSVPGHRGGER